MILRMTLLGGLSPGLCIDGIISLVYSTEFKHNDNKKKTSNDHVLNTCYVWSIVPFLFY